MSHPPLPRGCVGDPLTQPVRSPAMLQTNGVHVSSEGSCVFVTKTAIASVMPQNPSQSLLSQTSCSWLLDSNTDCDQGGRAKSEGRVSAAARHCLPMPASRLPVTMARGRPVSVQIQADSSSDASSLSFKQKLEVFSKSEARASSDPGVRRNVQQITPGQRPREQFTNTSNISKPISHGYQDLRMESRSQMAAVALANKKAMVQRLPGAQTHKSTPDPTSHDCSSSDLSFKQKVAVFSRSGARASSDPGICRKIVRQPAANLQKDQSQVANATDTNKTKKCAIVNLSRVAICVPNDAQIDFGLEGMERVPCVRLIATSQFSKTAAMATGNLVAACTQERKAIEDNKFGEVKDKTSACRWHPLLAATINFITGGTACAYDMEFVSGILTSSGYEIGHAVAAGIYLKRAMLSDNRHLVQPTWRKMFILALILADKVWSDCPAKTSDVLKLYENFESSEMLELEFKLMILLNWCTLITPGEYRCFCHNILESAGLYETEGFEELILDTTMVPGRNSRDDDPSTTQISPEGMTSCSSQQVRGRNSCDDDPSTTQISPEGMTSCSSEQVRRSEQVHCFCEPLQQVPFNPRMNIGFLHRVRGKSPKTDGVPRSGLNDWEDSAALRTPVRKKMFERQGEPLSSSKLTPGRCFSQIEEKWGGS